MLSVKGQGGTDVSVISIAGLPKLRNLILDHTAISAEVLVELRAVGATLTHLAIFGGSLDDDGLGALLPALPKLESLVLLGGSLTDSSVELLSTVESLKNLSVGNAGVSAKGIAALRLTLPECNIQ